MNLCITPRPPSRAIAMAIGASVTVSILEDIIGEFNLIFEVIFVEISILDLEFTVE